MQSWGKVGMGVISLHSKLPFTVPSWIPPLTRMTRVRRGSVGSQCQG